jgi:hypothetical protein
MSLQVYLTAGLGNRLFQYASVKGLARKYNLKFAVFAIDYNHEHNLNNYDWMLKQIFTKDSQIIQIPRHILNSQGFKINYPDIKIWNQPVSEHLGYFEPNIQTLTNNVLYGYFQSELYFENIVDELKEEFKEPSHITPVIDKYLESLILKNIEFKKSCIIHVRLKDKIGDALHFVDFGKYYERAIQEVRKKNPSTIFIILSETPNDTQVIYPKFFHQLGNENEDYFIVPRNFVNIECFDFYLITRFRTIISSSSTFAWWGAWLNPIPFPEKQVYLPNRFINDQMKNYLKDYVDMKGAQIIEID